MSFQWFGFPTLRPRFAGSMVLSLSQFSDFFSFLFRKSPSQRYCYVLIAIIIYKFSTSIVIVITLLRSSLIFPGFFSSRFVLLIHCHFGNFPLVEICCIFFCCSSVAFYCRSDSINVFLLAWWVVLYYGVVALRWLQGTCRRRRPNVPRPATDARYSRIVYPLEFPLSKSSTPVGSMVQLPKCPLARQPLGTMDWHLKTHSAVK